MEYTVFGMKRGWDLTAASDTEGLAVRVWRIDAGSAYEAVLQVRTAAIVHNSDVIAQALESGRDPELIEALFCPEPAATGRDAVYCGRDFWDLVPRAPGSVSDLGLPGDN